jgi:hypothetical protein
VQNAASCFGGIAATTGLQAASLLGLQDVADNQCDSTSHFLHIGV